VARFDRAIPPGGRGEIVLTLKTAGYQGKLRKEAVVHSNDPANPQVRLQLAAAVRVSIAVDPPAVLLEGIAGEEITRSVLIQANEAEPLALKLLPAPEAEKVAYELQEVEAGRIYKLVFRLAGTGAEKFGGILRLETNYPAKPQLQIGYLVAIKGLIELQPQRLVFSPLKRSEANPAGSKPAFPRRTVQLRTTDGKDLSIEKMEFDRRYFEVSVSENPGGSQRILTVTLKADALPAGILRDEIKVHTNLEPLKVISIPIEVRMP
jgi:hypothetical protein